MESTQFVCIGDLMDAWCEIVKAEMPGVRPDSYESYTPKGKAKLQAQKDRIAQEKETRRAARIERDRAEDAAHRQSLVQAKKERAKKKNLVRRKKEIRRALKLKEKHRQKQAEEAAAAEHAKTQETARQKVMATGQYDRTGKPIKAGTREQGFHAQPTRRQKQLARQHSQYPKVKAGRNPAIMTGAEEWKDQLRREKFDRYKERFKDDPRVLAQRKRRKFKREQGHTYGGPKEMEAGFLDDVLTPETRAQEKEIADRKEREEQLATNLAAQTTQQTKREANEEKLTLLLDQLNTTLTAMGNT